MNQEILLSLLEANKGRLQSLLSGIPREEAHYKPGPEVWSLLEVINHLYDEEKEDFRPRLEIVLENPKQPFSPIHPEAWVQERKYQQRDFQKSLDHFLKEREKSLDWLMSLQSPNWDSMYHTDTFSLRAGDLLASWVAHDQLHMRQIIELQRAWSLEASKPYNVDYAGQW